MNTDENLNLSTKQKIFNFIVDPRKVMFALLFFILSSILLVYSLFFVFHKYPKEDIRKSTEWESRLEQKNKTKIEVEIKNKTTN